MKILNLDSFADILKNIFERFLKNIQKDISSGLIKINKSYNFPTSLRVGESPYHYVAELVGSQHTIDLEKYNLTILKEYKKFPNTSTFFNPGLKINDNMKSILRIGTSRIVQLKDLLFTTKYDKKIFEEKINFSLSQTALKMKDVEVPLIILPECRFFIIRNVDIIRTESYRVFFRTFSTALSVCKHISENLLRKWIEWVIKKALINKNDLFGLNLGLNFSDEGFVRQLLSLTDQNVQESTLDSFIQDHIKEFCKALEYKDALSQPRLKWIEKDFDDDPDTITPDYLMQRYDGFYDILDLKTAALHEKSLTTGSRARFKFKDYVQKSIAQLTGYERYFKNHKNHHWIKKKLGVQVNNPRLIGIVGNYDNLKESDKKLALSQYKSNIIILSYADLINLLRKRS